MPQSKRRKRKYSGPTLSKSVAGDTAGMVMTPSLRADGGGTMQQMGVRPPAESLLVSIHMNYVQEMFQDQPANHCVFGCLVMQRALAKVGIDAEPVSVYAVVTRPDRVVRVGVPVPVAAPPAGWDGHLGLWLPRLHRFADPTIYQANRAGLGQIGAGLIIALGELQQLQDAEVEKNGALIQYGLADDPARGWRRYATAEMMTEVERAGDVIHRAVIQELAKASEGQRIVAELTDRLVRSAVNDAVSQLPNDRA